MITDDFNQKPKYLKYILYVFIVAIIVVTLIGTFNYFKNRENDIINDDKPNGESASFTAKFILNGASSITSDSVSCTIKNNSCRIKLPKATRDGGIVLGYSYNMDSKTADYFMNMDIELNNNITLYVISYKINTLDINQNELDYVEKNNLSCYAYNRESKCSVRLPSFNKIGYEVRGYSTSNKSLTGIFFPKENYELKEDTTLYPIYNTNARYQKINVRKTLLVNGSFIEIENTCPDVVANRYLTYLNDIKEYAPYLLFGNKITFLGDKSFDSIWGDRYVGMNFGPRKLRAFDIRCSTTVLNDYYGTMVHELGHSWDYFYSVKKGNNITSNADIINLFNKYKNMSNRPFRDYSYSNIYEFFADMGKYYYFKYTRKNSEYVNMNYPNDIKKVMEKYICIAKNDYDEEKCK